MLINTFVLAVVAISVANAQENCAAGKILGKFAICGSDPVDCGSGLCCQQGATCVADDTAGFRCGMPLASIDSAPVASNTGSAPVASNTGSAPVASNTGSAPVAINTGSSSSGNPQASTQNSPSSSVTLSKGALAGIIVGSVIAGLVLIAIIATLLLLAVRKINAHTASSSAKQEMGERSNSSVSTLQKPARAILGERSSTAKPRPISSGISR
ncbi:Cullin-3 [Venturia nashicola]|uniref:Cullin-3 n=1 Tax=Venturia nashicola TaxID=86259 RepID=A0A4Z1PEM9_9PEZI|nr:Cullin-3 [Venturia nashicola]